MNNTQKIVTLWLVIIIGYILHPLYELSGLFFGVDIKVAGATGNVPAAIHYLHLAFDIVPLLLVLLTLYFSGRKFRVVSLVIAILFFIANLLHLVETAKKEPSLSQLTLLSYILLANLLLVLTTNQWRKETTANGNA